MTWILIAAMVVVVTPMAIAIIKADDFDPGEH